METGQHCSEDRKGKLTDAPRELQIWIAARPTPPHAECIRTVYELVMAFLIDVLTHLASLQVSQINERMHYSTINRWHSSSAFIA
jgi:hypothetical protein